MNSWLAVLKHDFRYFTEALELSRTAIHWLFEKTQILPQPLTEHYSRQVNEDLVRVLNDHMESDQSDRYLDEILNSWRDLDEKTQSKIHLLIEEDLKRKSVN